MLPWQKEGYADPLSWLAYRRVRHREIVIGRYNDKMPDGVNEKKESVVKEMDVKKILLVVVGLAIAYFVYKKFAK